MPFTRTQSAVPADIGKLFVRFGTVDGDTAVFGTTDFEVIDANGKIVGVGVYDIIANMSPAQVNAVTNLMTAIRNKAKAEAV